MRADHAQASWLCLLTQRLRDRALPLPGVRKKPSPQASKPWKTARIQKRWLETRGYSVDYYDHQPRAGSQPKASFDLRHVTMLRPAKECDPTAPDWAIEVIVSKHHIVIDFLFPEERDSCLKIWANGVPQSAMPANWADGRKARSREMEQKLKGILEPPKPARLYDDDEGFGEEETEVAPPTDRSYAGRPEGTERVVKEGWLWKQGHVRQSWKQRYFRLTSHGQLKYYEEATPDAKMIDAIPLTGCSIFVPKSQRSEQPNAFRLQLDRDRKRKYILAADSATDSKQWHQAILRHAPSLPAESMQQSQPGTSAAEMRAPGYKRKVMVLGSTGNVGQATLHWLVQRYGSTLEIQAGTRDPTRLAAMPGVVPVAATIHDAQESWLKPLDCLILITPGNDQRVPSTIKMATAAAKVGVGHIIVVSVITADLSDTVFGGQFQQIESAVKDVCSQSRSRYTLARLPLFLENYYGFSATVKEQGLIACSMDPDKPYCPIAVSDIGEALAAIAAEPTSKYLNQTLSLAGEPHTCGQMVQWLGEARDSPVEYKRISSGDVRKTLLDFGFLHWQADGIIQLYDLVSDGRYVYSAETLRAVLGHEPLPVQEWLRSAAPAFEDERPAGAKSEDNAQTKSSVDEQALPQSYESNIPEGPAQSLEQSTAAAAAAAPPTDNASGQLPEPPTPEPPTPEPPTPEPPTDAPADVPTDVPYDREDSSTAMGVAVVVVEGAVAAATSVAGSEPMEAAGREEVAASVEAAVEASVEASVEVAVEAESRPMRPRQPTIILMEEMEEVWKQVFLLESAGKVNEAASYQAEQMVKVKERYDSHKLAMEDWVARAGGGV